MIARLLLLPVFIVFIALLAIASDAFANAKCGGAGQRECTVLEQIPSCDKGLAAARGKCHRCGGAGEVECPFTVQVPSCDRGLAAGGGKCRACGGAGEMECPVSVQVPSCDAGLAAAGGKCGACGGAGAVHCPVTVRKQPCDDGLVADYIQGRCVPADQSRAAMIAAHVEKAESLRPLHDCIATPGRKERFTAALSARSAADAGAVVFECLGADALAGLRAVPQAARPYAPARNAADSSTCSYDGFNTLTVGVAGASVQAPAAGIGGEFGVAINLSPCVDETIRLYTAVDRTSLQLIGGVVPGLGINAGIDVLPVGLSYSTVKPGTTRANGVGAGGKVLLGGTLLFWWDDQSGAHDGFSVAFGVGIGFDFLSQHKSEMVIY